MFSSGQTAFYIESSLRVNALLGLNSTPQMLLPPIDKAAVGQKFIHNPGAYDLQGDSLSYRLTTCKQGKDIDVTDFRSPEQIFQPTLKEDGSAPSTLTLNPITGELVWDAPMQPGQYNIAFFIDEWRGGILISSTNRDMQIIVTDNRNKRPRLTLPKDTCVIAGDFLFDTIVAKDPDNHAVILTHEGGVFSLNTPRKRATFSLFNLQPPNGEEHGLFQWVTTCFDVQREHYSVYFKTEDVPVPFSNRLADIQTWLIKVIGPQPDTVIATLTQNTPTAQVTVSWLPYDCGNASRMTVWHRKSSFDYVPEHCETGLPASAGYTRIGTVPITTLNFVDDNNGKGLERGLNHCYRIFAQFPEPAGGEGIVSEEACVFVPATAPYITNVSVEKTSANAGEIFVRWTRPFDADTVLFPRPYQYKLVRINLDDNSRTELPTLFAEKDTFFTDINLNTANIRYAYQVKLFSNTALIDSSAIASQVNLTAGSSLSSISLNWSNFQTPWNNKVAKFPLHYIYRKRTDNSNIFDLIDSTDVTQNGFTYTDRGTFNNIPLLPNTEYCYRITTIGSYEYAKIADSLVNQSIEICTFLLDTIKPCAPVILDNLFTTDATLECELPPAGDCPALKRYTNQLYWKKTVNNSGCDNDIIKFNVYHAPASDNNYSLIYTTTDTVFKHQNLASVAGCYRISAVDVSNNESFFSSPICVKNCPYYELPNVFTPNGDGKNDLFRPYACPRFTEKVNFQVYNRWGTLVHESDDSILLNWNGNTNNGRRVADGTYFYHAKVFIYTETGTLEEKNIKGTIQVLGGQ
jgi:gliding motility-associated-like protein